MKYAAEAAFSFFAAVFVGLVSCAPSESKKAPPAAEPAPAPSCGLATGQVLWEVWKNETAIVTGRQDITGVVEAKDGAIGVALQVAARPSSGISLRDDRIESIVWGSAPIVYTGAVLSPLPAPGDTIKANLDGELTLAGETLRMVFTAYVDNVDAETLQARGKAELDMQNLGIRPEVDTMLALVGATVADKVEVEYVINFKGPCQ